MNEKKDKKSKKPEHVSKNWKSSQGIRLLAMVLAIVSGFFVAVTSVVTVTLGMNSDWQGSQKDIEKILDTELLRSYAYWMGDAVTGISKEQDEADALKKFDDGNIVYSLVKNKPNEKETELVCGNYTGTSLNKENALAWLKFTDEMSFIPMIVLSGICCLEETGDSTCKKSSIIRRWIILSMIMV